MKPYRGLTKDGKMVYGNLIYLRHADKIEGARRESYFIQEIEGTYYGAEVEPCNRGWSHNKYEVIPATVAQQVGLRDKNEKEGYENDKVSFGSTRPVYLIKWSICDAGFYLESIDEQKEHLGIGNLIVGKIIPPEVKEKSK